jgi:uncharacterized membrane protein
VSGPLVALTGAAAVGCGLVGGVFFAFSSFVMPALGRLEPAEGVAAMQSINRLAVTPPFMAALFGTGLACAGLVAWGAVRRGEGGAPWALAGGALYLVGALGVTLAGNVPLNERLADLAPRGAEAAAAWPALQGRWTALNHVRSAACAAAAAALVVALRTAD